MHGTDGGSNLTLPVFAVAISLSMVLAVPKRLSLPVPSPIPPRRFHSVSSESCAVEFASAMVEIYLNVIKSNRLHPNFEEKHKRRTTTTIANKLTTSAVRCQTHQMMMNERKIIFFLLGKKREIFSVVVKLLKFVHAQ